MDDGALHYKLMAVTLDYINFWVPSQVKEEHTPISKFKHLKVFKLNQCWKLEIRMSTNENKYPASLLFHFFSSNFQLDLVWFQFCVLSEI